MNYLIFSFENSPSLNPSHIYQHKEGGSVFSLVFTSNDTLITGGDAGINIWNTKSKHGKKKEKNCFYNSFMFCF